MMKALYFQFIIGSLPLFAVTWIGYWAYGNSTATYLLSSVNGPVWVKTMANISAFLQSVIALHVIFIKINAFFIYSDDPLSKNFSLIFLLLQIFASPMYEYLDTKFGIKGSALALRNLSFRLGVRGGYLSMNTLVSALLPFLGDFESLTGAISTFPLTFILANHMYLRAKKSELTKLQKKWHWLNVCFFSCMSVAAAVAALRLIAVDSKTYHVFADL